MGVLSAVAFYVLVGALTEDPAEATRPRIFVTALVIVILIQAVGVILPNLRGVLVGGVLAMAIAAASLIFWMKIDTRTSWKIASAFVAIHFGLSIAVNFLLWTLVAPR